MSGFSLSFHWSCPTAKRGTSLIICDIRLGQSQCTSLQKKNFCFLWLSFDFIFFVLWVGYWVFSFLSQEADSNISSIGWIANNRHSCLPVEQHYKMCVWLPMIDKDFFGLRNMSLQPPDALLWNLTSPPILSSGSTAKLTFAVCVKCLHNYWMDCHEMCL